MVTQLAGPAKPADREKDSRSLVMCKNEHPNGSYPEFRAVGKTAIKETPLEEVGSYRLKMGRSWMVERNGAPQGVGNGERGDIPS